MLKYALWKNSPQKTRAKGRKWKMATSISMKKKRILKKTRKQPSERPTMTKTRIYTF
jgi:hypothetical protein